MAFKDNFRGDSAYTQIMTKIFNIFWLSILWLLCCIPVITIGASTIALYYVMLKLVKDEETTVTREFFHSFKQNFLQSLPESFLYLLGGGSIHTDSPLAFRFPSMDCHLLLLTTMGSGRITTPGGSEGRGKKNTAYHGFFHP